MEWTRRQLLAALGAGAAAPLLASLLHACARETRAPSAPVQPAVRDAGQLGDQLRSAVAALSRRFAHASALATVRRMGGAVVDAGERSVFQEEAAWLVLRVAAGERAFEQVTTDLSAAGITRATDALEVRAAAARRSRTRARPLASPRTLRLGAAAVAQPESSQAAAWLGRAAALHARAGRVGGSRVIYRGAYALVDEHDSLFVGEGRDLRQHLVRSRAGVWLAAHGAVHHHGRLQGGPPAWGADAAGSSSLRVEEVSRGGLVAQEPATPTDAALETAAARVLALTSPARPAEGVMDVILAPDLAARILYECVAPALTADRWLAGARAASLAGQPIGPAQLTLIDDPTMPGGFGSYAFDDEGQAAAPAVLLDRGVLAGPLTDRTTARALHRDRTGHGRRRGPTSPVTPLASNLVLAPGTARLDELVAGIAHGYLLEGGTMARVDLGTWRFVARAARAYEIRRGKRTGVLFGALDLCGDVPALLGAVQGLSGDSQRFCHGGGPDPAASVTCPAVWTRARVVAGGPAAPDERSR